jgi:hypothetical protein
MFLHSRRFSVWLVSFLMVLIVYFIYNRVNRTPVISTTSEAPAGTQQTGEVYEGNTITGKVGNVGVGTAKNVRYTKLNEQKQVEREFGFDELLHQDGNEWEIEKPYYSIYGKEFKSMLTGDKARITVEASGGQVVPKEGILTGNVMIRISPTHGGSFSDAVIYLDDISFEGGKSLFSTDGLVEIDSNEVQMKGRGLEIIFNGGDEKLEYLKIARLKSLRIKQWSKGAVLAAEGGADSEKKDKTGDKQPGSDKSGKAYKCVIDKNVIIETPQERLLAQIVSISNFSMSGSSRDKQKTEKNVEHRTPISSGNIERSTEDRTGGITISCDGGIMVVPMDATKKRTENIEHRTQNIELKSEERKDNKTIFCGQEIDYDAESGEAAATGPSQIIFDINTHAQQPPVLGKPAPGPETVMIVSQKGARFQPALKRAAFDGDCKCTVTQKTGDINQQYIVTAEKLEAILKPKAEKADSSTALDIERFVARGGEVRLASTKKAGEQLLAGVEMKCAGMDYNTVSRDFAATGPGLIKYVDSQADEPQKGLSRFSLKRKCIALLRNFDSLQFSGQSGHLTADAGGGSMLVDYFPVGDSNAVLAKNVSGSPDKVSITASHVESDISQTPQGRMELGDFTATGAVTYKDSEVEVEGSEFAYDVNNALINVRGSRLMPLRFNRVIFDTIQYDVKNEKWRTKIKGPGAIR